MTENQIFIQEVFQNQEVIILQSDEGFAVTYSESFVYEDDSPLEVICFWSSAQKVKEAQHAQWQQHKIETISLPDFMEQWLIGMIEEVALAGINLDAKGNGEEVLPMDLLLDLCNYGIKNHPNFSLKHFKTLEALRQEIIQFKEESNLTE